MLISLLTYLSLALTPQPGSECPPEAANFDYQSAIISADAVFKGMPVSGQSAIGMDEEHRRIIESSHTFQVDEYFKDTTGRNENRVSVSQRTIGSDTCHNGPRSGETSLIFARGSTFFMMDSCNYGFPWECVPESARAILSGSK
uniref:Uncharacterized protein n=1 Tax=Arion vulgaris TaxID=1028688 RepID=A0A0B7A4Y5_9EUPU